VHLKVDVHVHVRTEPVHERLELREGHVLFPSQSADRLTRVHQAIGDELAGTVDCDCQSVASLLPIREQAGALELDRGRGQRVGQHVVQLGGYPPALSGGRSEQVRLPGVGELSQQQLCAILALPALPHQVGNQS